MGLEIRQYVDNPGQRFLVQVALSGTGEADDQLRTVDEIRLDGQAFAQLSTLYLDVTITAAVRQPCRRCLIPVTTTVELEEVFEIPISPGVEEVELWPDVVRLVLSAHDPNVICKASCQGLCPVCGVNLNKEPDHDCAGAEKADDSVTLGDYLSWPDES